MKVTIVRFEKLINLGNYENQKLGVEVQLDEGETPSEAIKRAKAFVESHLAPKVDTNYDIEQAKRIVANPDDYAPKKVREAQTLLDRVVQEDQIPF
jgi:hypothetical protein